MTPPRGGGRGGGAGRRSGAPKGASGGKGAPKGAQGGRPSAPKGAGRGAAPTGKGSGPARRGTGTGGGGRPVRQGPAGQSARRGLGGDQVEGRQAVRELLLAGRRRVREIWVLAEQEPSDVLADILAIAEAERVQVREVGRSKFFAEARCEAPQGVLAKAAPLEETLLDDLVTTGKGAPPPFLIAVDGVTDPGNLGALLRSAECAGATGVVLPRHRSVHVTPTVTKSAAGAVEHLPMAVVAGLPAAITQLQQLGVWVVGLDGDGGQELWSMPAADGPIALVLGAEGTGLSRLVKERCDAVVRIPLQGSLGSLNVAAAAAVACYEVARTRA